MTVKTREVVNDALETLVVQAEEQEIPQSEGNAAIRTLNDMMAQWSARGIDIGYTEVENMADVLTVPPGTILGIKHNLAINLAPKYNRPITPAMLKNANDGYRAIVSLAVDMGSSAFPSTLPQGSGNTGDVHTDNTFYPDEQETILTETGGSIALEDETEGS